MKKFLTVLTILFLFPFSAFSIDAGNILHIAPDVNKFEPVGRTLVLQARLQGTRNINNKLRLLVTIDGDFMEVSSEQVRWDEKDRPVFDFKIYYPKKELSYKFVLDTYTKTGETERYISRNYSFKRPCKLNPPIDTKDPLKKGFFESNNAAREVSVREDIYNILKELSEGAE